MPVVDMSDENVKRSELSPEVLKELNADYLNEQHIESFAAALEAEFFHENDYLDSRRHSLAGRSSSTGTIFNFPAQGSRMSMQAGAGGNPTRIRKVSAYSDLAPVSMQLARRKKGVEPPVKKHDWLFVVFRWPFLILLLLFISLEFALYIVVRQFVRAKEYFTAWKGQKGALKKKLLEAKTYQEWKAAAKAIDQFLQFNDWKGVDEDPLYDWKLVRKVSTTLRTLRKDGDVRGVLGVLETCIRPNFAGIESARLYSETFYGTKDLIELYLSELERSIAFVRDTSLISETEKKRFFKSVNTNLGLTALCFSGGATFGHYHWGVLKAFVDANMLPKVITGTSAGSLIAALACTRTDPELKRLLIPELADRVTLCSEGVSVWSKRVWETGSILSRKKWAKELSFFTMGSLTFKEAYMRTGRILNISVIPADRHSPTKLLNYITAPDTVIWSSILASCAVPGLFNPVVLMQKARDGSIIPWNWGSKFKDGSLRVDIPLQSLNHYFNVTHPVVSQVNPHIHLFLFAPRGSAGQPVPHKKGEDWRGNFLLSAAERTLKLEVMKNLSIIRDLDLLPEFLGQDWSGVFLQKFEGAVTLWPKSQLSDWINLLKDPDHADMDRRMKAGEIVTWPKLHMIENRYRIEREIFRGRRSLRKAGAKPNGLNKAQESTEKVTVTPPFDEKHLKPILVDTKSTSTPQLEHGGSDGIPSTKSRAQHRSSQAVDFVDTGVIKPIPSSQYLTADNSPVKPQRQGPPSSARLSTGGLIDRIRKASLVDFTNPFPNAVRRLSKISFVEPNVEEEWSSDSSDVEDFHDASQFYEPVSVDLDN